MSDLRPDVAAAKARMRGSIGGGREIKRLTEHLWPDETVELMAVGNYGRGTGLLALTNRRLLFILDGMLAKTSEDFPLDKISSIQWASGLALGTITVFASGNKAEIKNVNKDNGKVIVDAVRGRISGPPAPAPAPQAVAGVDVADQLAKLAALRDQGVLTEAEFATQKAKLLG